MKIKKLIRGAIAAAVACFLTTTALAQVVTVTIVPGYQQGSGGEFNVAPVIGEGYAPTVLVNDGYETFCLARDTGIVIPGSYLGTVDTNGLYILSPTKSKILSSGAAWLYQQFALGTLPRYDYTNSGTGVAFRTNSAGRLQEAIWFFEGTYGNDIAGYENINPFARQATNFFGSVAAAQVTNSPGGFNVGALNLSSLVDGHPIQPVLVLLPTNPPCVDPSAAITAPVSVIVGTTNTASVPDAGAGATYAWSISNGSIIDGQGTSSITWVAGSEGPTVLNVTISLPGGCGATGTHTVNVVCDNPDATITTPVTVDAGSTNSASVPDAGPGATYVWTINNGTITDGQGTPNITWSAGASGAVIINVTVTKANGCDAQGMKMITIKCETPCVNIWAPICVTVASTNSASVADAGPGAVYAWTINNGTIISGQGTRTIKWQASGSGITTLNVTVTVVGGCYASDCRKVYVICKDPEAKITAAVAVDRGSTNNTASVADAGSGATYVWYISGGTITSGQGTKAITWKAGTGNCATISVKVTVPGGCYDTGCKTVTLLCAGANATITAPYSVKACTVGNVASVPSAGTGATYVWTINNGKITSGQGTSSIKFTAGLCGKTTITVKVTTAAGCYETGCKTVCITSNYNWSNCDNNYVNQCLSQWASSYSNWGCSWYDRWW